MGAGGRRPDGAGPAAPRIGRLPGGRGDHARRLRPAGERELRGALAALACPVELVWGDDDAEVPVAVAEAAAAAVAGATLTLCVAAGHQTPESVPAVLRAAVERALGRP